MEPRVPSQTSSHFTIEPIPASTLADREAQRRNAAVALGYCKSGCSELDDHVLMGGFERGCVVGISSEDEDFGVQLGLQTLAHSLTRGRVRGGMVVTPRPAGRMLGELRRCLAAELRAMGVVGEEAVDGRVRDGLESVLVACVFDVDGLWEALAELDRPFGGDEAAVVVGEELEEAAVEEIRDSQDSSPSSSISSLPDMVLITHFSSLLTSLFAHRENAAAHSALQLLSAHLRHLARSLPSTPLILILNNTTTTTTTITTTIAAEAPPPHKPPANQSSTTTLSSVFDAPRCRPRFGNVFARVLDVHLLCSRVARARARGDAEAVVVLEGRERDSERGSGRRTRTRTRTTAGETVWVVECLLDDMGVWEGRMGRRMCREQRWAAVDVEGGGRVKDAFEETVQGANVDL